MTEVVAPYKLRLPAFNPIPLVKLIRKAQHNFGTNFTIASEHKCGQLRGLSQKSIKINDMIRRTIYKEYTSGNSLGSHRVNRY